MIERDSVPTWNRYLPWAAFATLLAGGLVVWLRFGAPAVVLWFAFAALAGATLLFWESLRALLDRNAAGDEEDGEGDHVPSDLEAKKSAALRALRDIEFERSIGRISDEDYAGLREKYRTEAREAMEAMDQGLGGYLATAEEMIAHAGDPAPANRRKARKDKPGSATPSSAEAAAAKSEDVAEAKGEPDAESPLTCAKCAASNDLDAVFCKKCGTRLRAEAT